MMKIRRPWIAPLIVSLMVLSAAIMLLKTNETAREVAGESALTIFQVLTTPFVLETALALLGLCIVIAINHHRQKKDGDEWVYLEQKAPSASSEPNDDPPHRHDAVVWHEKPAAFDETATELDVVEGYLDLGLADDALREWSSLPPSASRSERAVAMHIRALAMSGRYEEAIAAFDATAKEPAGRTEPLASLAFSVALWLHDNKKPAAEAKVWVKRCHDLDGRVFDRLCSGHPSFNHGGN